MPIRELLLLRHAKSSWGSDADTDFDRPLAKRGKKDCPRLGAWLAARDALPDCVVSSPARRARQTARRVLQAAGGEPEAILYDERLYGAGAQTVLRIIAESPADCRRVMIVAHYPALEEVAMYLGGDAVGAGENGKIYPTGTLSWFSIDRDWEFTLDAEAELLDIVRPRSLREA